MTFVLPYPTSPSNGDAGNADPIRQNFQATAQAIQSFDGSQIQAATVQEAALANAVNPRLRGSETMNNFVYSGCVWSTVSGLNGTMTGGTVYVNGYRTLVNAIGSYTFTASQDTYMSVDYLGNITPSPVANNAAPPALPANSIWLAVVVTNGSSITSIRQSGDGGSGNTIYPVGVSAAWQSWTPTVVGFSSTTTAQYWYKQVGKTVYFMINVSGTSNSTSFTITLPVTASTHVSNLEGIIALALNNGAVVTASPRWEIVTSTNPSLMNLYSGVTGTGWTASGTKIAAFQGFYEGA